MANTKKGYHRTENGEGNCYDKEDGTFLVKITVPGRRSPLQRTFKVKKDADKFLHDMRKQKYQPSYNRICSFSKYAKDYWLPNQKLGMKPRSYHVLETNCWLHVLPLIGTLKISDIDNKQMNKMIQTLLAQECSLSLIHKCYCIVTSCLRYAAEQKDIASLPVFTKLKLSRDQFPFLKEKEIEYYDDHEIQIYIDECDRKYKTAKKVHRNGAVYKLLMHTGMRSGEVVALEWTDYDEKAQTIRIRKDAVYTKSAKTGQYETIIQSSPKTKASDRLIHLNRQAIDDLKELQQLNGKSKYICANGKGCLMNPNVLYQGHQVIVKNAGLKETGIHSLRHSFVTHMYYKGISELKDGKSFDPHTFAREVGHGLDIVNVERQYIIVIDCIHNGIGVELISKGLSRCKEL